MHTVTIHRRRREKKIRTHTIAVCYPFRDKIKIFMPIEWKQKKYRTHSHNFERWSKRKRAKIFANYTILLIAIYFIAFSLYFTDSVSVSVYHDDGRQHCVHQQPITRQENNELSNDSSMIPLLLWVYQLQSMHFSLLEQAWEHCRCALFFLSFSFTVVYPEFNMQIANKIDLMSIFLLKTFRVGHFAAQYFSSF